MELSFALHKLVKFSANPGKVHFEGLVHILRYIRDNKTLGLKYYVDMNDAPVTDLLIHYRACIGSLIDLLSTRVELSFALHKLVKFSANPGKVHFEGLVHLLRYIRYNKTLVLNFYADINDALVSYLLRQSSIKTENLLMAIYDSSWKYYPDSGRSTGSYMIFYQGRSIDYGTHVINRRWSNN